MKKLLIEILEKNFFSKYIKINHLKHLTYKNEPTEMKYLNSTHKKKRILNVMNKQLFKIKKRFQTN